MCTIIAIVLCWVFDIGVWLVVLGLVIDVLAMNNKKSKPKG